MTDLITEKKPLNKFCSFCGKFKPIDDFYWLPSVKRYHSYCKECDKIHKHLYYLKNKEAIDAKNKKWQENNYQLHLIHQHKYNSKRVNK